MDTKIKKSLLDKLHNCTGKVGFYYKNMVTGEKIEYNSYERFVAASVIKLPIFSAVMKMASEGKLNLDKQILIKDGEILPSCGAINLFSGERLLNLRTICNFMIALSDNTATNVVINQCGINELNKQFKEIGLEDTHIERKLFDEEAASEGRENYFTPYEIGNLLERLYRNEFVNQNVSQNIIDTLKMQNINHKIPGLLEEKFEIAHKTGEDDGITHDVGIVYCEEPFVIVFASNDTNVGEFENLIRKESLILSSVK